MEVKIAAVRKIRILFFDVLGKTQSRTNRGQSNILYLYFAVGKCSSIRNRGEVRVLYCVAQFYLLESAFCLCIGSLEDWNTND
ncbi:hypothetical protein Ocin01_05507 [Orchesella cincta]|uniref:Uncharacterized protein n=1 Tax=Orchesella cincta TaxID=48709 RepID=A0A1D2N7D6_ORCCI|nr:hypothetical protein Ocin01_05507 [Orchesella cincta]